MVTSIVGSRNYALTIEGPAEPRRHHADGPAPGRGDRADPLRRGAARGLRGPPRRIDGLDHGADRGPPERGVDRAGPGGGLGPVPRSGRRGGSSSWPRRWNGWRRRPPAATGLRFDLEARPPLAPTAIDRRLQQAIAEAAEGPRPRPLAPDALRRPPRRPPASPPCCPSRMLFVPSIGGVSHSFEEDTALPDLVTGAEVMAGAVERVAT